VIRGPSRNLIIDTGLDNDDCHEAMARYIGTLEIDLRNTDFLITHLHRDHFGLVSKLVTDTSKILFNKTEFDFLRSEKNLENIFSYTLGKGFPKKDLPTSFSRRPLRKVIMKIAPKIEIVKEGDTVHVGQYRFKCVFTPGHSWGHMCLYEPNRKFLVAGDHILDDITPGIQCHSDDANPLKQYLTSLRKVEKMDIALVLPGHKKLFKDHKHRIQTIQKHHDIRLNEVLRILKDGPMNAYQIASKMVWDMNGEQFHRASNVQRWFATSEALAHIRYLEEEGRVIKNVLDTKGKTPDTYQLSVEQVHANGEQEE
jgi:glyoxylase-like metal-dependent hydrolase (beta-lactamase superfamily II)